MVESAPGAQRVRQLASGAGDFLLTGSLYYFQALTEDGALPVRFVSAVHQRSSVAALVREDSEISVPSDLAARRLGGPGGRDGLGWLVRQFLDDLDRLGVGQTEHVPLAHREAMAALEAGTIDFVANLAELAPLVAQRAGVGLRAIPVGGETYLSGVVAADEVSADLVIRMQAAVRETLTRQRLQPRRGLEGLVGNHPHVDGEDAVASWLMLEPYVFVDDGPGGMNERRWAETVRQAASVHRTASIPVDAVWRSGSVVSSSPEDAGHAST